MLELTCNIEDGQPGTTTAFSYRTTSWMKSSSEVKQGSFLAP